MDDTQRLGVHLSHCNMGEHVGECKYGDDDCPVFVHDWKWFGDHITRLENENDRLFEQALELKGEIARLKGHLPDICITEECDKDGNVRAADVAAMSVNERAGGLKGLSDDALVKLVDTIGDYAHKAIQCAVRERDKEIRRLKGEVAEPGEGT